jgi:hypothetical protein
LMGLNVFGTWFDRYSFYFDDLWTELVLQKTFVGMKFCREYKTN